ncbi:MULTISPECIES: gamma-glutamyl-gamma-aminobutyrate hydrolase family protein [Asticcacaulis]|uniref:gamma-glutamyl-gamma-aminobutyrate hydrolase family protein n=1 Tax=Asticcacaulis TaxID=76890 RepID=UPI001AE595D4|nr:MULTISPECIES: gamma-glutamyl-gamma-aminobutyrate hydrolase family protein [Asticcacaulis]MBP2161433.1 putative glutamine amidotransferase [Asticcacaulis solisilvae]MDR6802478.1 putative glutamine amidotransferase [Asticcacaulis sp. BE141]
MADKPVVGIMACNRTVGVENAHAVMERYVRAAIRYGDCHALLIPPVMEGFSSATVTRHLDGLMLTGSPSNIGARRYGQDGGDGPYDEGRDDVSLAMIECMITMGKPVFGICRGFQEINVVLGGSLRRDIGSAVGNRLAHHAPDTIGFEAMFDHTHPVVLTPGGVLSEVYGRDELMVNSVHFQGVDKLGDGLTVEAVAPDGQVEAFSANISGSQVLGVQWHPEWQVDKYSDSQVFFRLMGQALRGAPVTSLAGKHAKL